MKNIIIIIVVLHINILNAAFNNSGSFSARAAGMAGAFSAIADDASAQTYNTAGLADADTMNIIFTYSKIFAGIESVNLNNTYFAFAMPIENIGTLGAGYNSFSVTELYSESSFILSYGVNVKKLISLKKSIDLLWGINLKYMSHGFTLDKRSIIDPVFANGSSKGNLSIDTGIILKNFIPTFKNFAASLFFKNINSPDVGLKEYDYIPIEYILGMSYIFNRNKIKIPQINLCLDINYRNGFFNILSGAEIFLLRKRVIIRGGINFNEFTLGLGTLYAIKKSMQLSFDYAFLYPFSIKESYGSHQISVKFKF